MGKKLKQVDAYIAGSAKFAQPILRHLRRLVHSACPQAEEKIKWGMPFFDYNGMLCHMAAFQQHCAFGLWKHALILEAEQKSATAMGQFGRITRLEDLPAEATLKRLVKRAMALNDQGIGNKPKPRAAKRPPPRTPPDLAVALMRNAKARVTYEYFSASNKRDYTDWITEARTEATRAKRLATAIEWMAEGKIRHWKFQR